MFYKSIIGVLVVVLLVLSTPNVGRASTQYDLNNIAQIEELIRLLESLRAYLAKLQGGGAGSVEKTASITNVTSGENPIISGRASGYSKVGFSIGNGDKVYGSGDIAVINGYWSHKVATDLEDGEYQVDLYVDSSRLVDSYEFVVGEQSEDEYISEDEKVPGPQKNYYSCNRNSDGDIDDGQLACYGLWDFGSEFGNDDNMCQTRDYAKAITGCEIEAPVCASGEAIASRVINTYAPWHSSNRGGSLASASQIETIAKNLKTSPSAVKTQLIQVWEYKCVGDRDDEDDDDGEHSIWSYPQDRADIVVVGVYEGGYPAGVTHSGGNHPEGAVIVDVQSITANTVLILNAYEPVHWKITGVNAKYIKGVLVTGYHDQRVSGLSSNVPVLEQTYENGADSDEFFIVYNGQDEGDDEFSELVDYVEGKTGLEPYLFFGGYAKDRIVVSLKG